jgi:hypothetical protein
MLDSSNSFSRGKHDFFHDAFVKPFLRFLFQIADALLIFIAFLLPCLILYCFYRRFPFARMNSDKSLTWFYKNILDELGSFRSE